MSLGQGGFRAGVSRPGGFALGRNILGKDKVWNLPNNLSLVRILAVPVVMLLLAFDSYTNSLLATAVFVAASLTDLLDGFLARRHRQVTALGKLLDPMADKLLISAALIMMIPLGRAPAWMVFLIVAREIAVTGLRGAVSYEGIIIDASRLGKYKTVSQILAVSFLLLPGQVLVLGLGAGAIGLVLLWLALALTVWSGVDYFIKFYRILAKT